MTSYFNDSSDDDNDNDTNEWTLNLDILKNWLRNPEIQEVKNYESLLESRINDVNRFIRSEGLIDRHNNLLKLSSYEKRKQHISFQEPRTYDNLLKYIEANGIEYDGNPGNSTLKNSDIWQEVERNISNAPPSLFMVKFINSIYNLFNLTKLSNKNNIKRVKNLIKNVMNSK